MSQLSRREYTLQRLERLSPEDRQPLYRRFAYDRALVIRQWDALDETALRHEQEFLRLDLVFPLLYGGALAFSLFMASAMLGLGSKGGWVIAPALITVLADWTENLVQLGQLKLYQTKGGAELQAGWIQIASLATSLKLVSSIAASLVLVLMVILIIRSGGQASY